MIRLSADGRLDDSYGDSGIVRLTGREAAGRPADAEVTAAGELFLGLSTKPGRGVAGRAAVLKLTASGAPDGSFGAGGVLRLRPISRTVRLDSVGLLQGDRLILAVTDQGSRSQSGRLLAVWQGSGRLDRSFGSAGSLTSDLLVLDTSRQGPHGLLVAGVILSRVPQTNLRRAEIVIERRRV